MIFQPHFPVVIDSLRVFTLNTVLYHGKMFHCMYGIVSGHVENRPDSSPLILCLRHLFCVAMAVVSCLDHSDHHYAWFNSQWRVGQSGSPRTTCEEGRGV